MSRTSASVTLLLLTATLSVRAQAMTNAELARTNNEIISLDAELAVAKKRQELAKYKMPPLPPTPAAPITPDAGPEAEQAQAQNAVTLRRIHATDAGMIVADFEMHGQTATKGEGEVIFDSWRIVKIGTDKVKLKPVNSKVAINHTIVLRIKPEGKSAAPAMPSDAASPAKAAH